VSTDAFYVGTLSRVEHHSAGAIIRAKAPLRISFVGGGTDLEHYFTYHPGATLSSTINRYAHVSLFPRQDHDVEIRSLNLGYSVHYSLEDEPAYDGTLDLAKAAIRRIHLDRGAELDIRMEAPQGSGLGGSSALTAAVIGAVAASNSHVYSAYELAELNYAVERTDLKIVGGKQDQYATTFGGFNLLEFHKDRVVVTPLRVDGAVLNDLEAHLLLCYTGRVRPNLGLVSQQIEFYREGRPETLHGMQRLFEMVYEMKEALLTGNLDLFGRMLDEAYISKKHMNPHVADNTPADALYAEAKRHGAIGGKLLGAGGGGYLLLFCETGKQQLIRQALEAMGGQFTDFSFEGGGLQVWRSSTL
jgi:D-glycero-alpha-D-manno-heptose-7-phosphate kinase